ncbi:MAG: hypothetical protein ACLQT7_08155 [Candidatus Dormibacteria bacterium]
MRVALAAVLLMASASACSGPTTGVVSGGIQPCSALAIAHEPRYAPGTVTVLRGEVGRRSTGPGSWSTVLPTQVVASQQVGLDATYTFALRPGAYVVVGRQAGLANAPRWIEVTVRAGQTVDADIPNDCI